MRLSNTARRGANLLSGRCARLGAALAGVAILVPTVTAQATTGADALNKPPIYKPTKTQGAPYLGGYTLASHGAGILASTMRTAVNAEGYLQGTISVTQYSGTQPGTFVAELYEYHDLGSQMEVDLWTPDLGSALLGHLFLHRVGKDLTGRLEIDAKRIAVTYKSVPAGDAASEVTQAATNSGTTQTLISTAGVFSTAVVLAESISSTK